MESVVVHIAVSYRVSIQKSEGRCTQYPFLNNIPLLTRIKLVSKGEMTPFCVFRSSQGHVRTFKIACLSRYIVPNLETCRYGIHAKKYDTLLIRRKCFTMANQFFRMYPVPACLEIGNN